MKKKTKIEQIREFFLEHPEGLTKIQVSKSLKIAYTTTDNIINMAYQLGWLIRTEKIRQSNKFLGRNVLLTRYFFIKRNSWKGLSDLYMLYCAKKKGIEITYNDIFFREKGTSIKKMVENKYKEFKEVE